MESESIEGLVVPLFPRVVLLPRLGPKILGRLEGE